MADETLNFTTQIIGGDKIIRVDKKAIQVHAGDTVAFTNSLNGNPDIVVQFYDIGSTTPISGFCANISGDILEISSGATVDCELMSDPSVFVYTAQTAPGTPVGQQHVELDPVIIITPSVQPLLSFLTTAAGQAVGLGLAVVLIIAAWVFGVRKGRQDRTAPAA